MSDKEKADEHAPETVSDEALKDVQGGITLDNGIRNRITLDNGIRGQATVELSEQSDTVNGLHVSKDIIKTS